MLIFFTIILLIAIILFFLGIKVQKMLEREKVDAEYAKKRQAFRDKYGKWWDFGYNLFWWIVSILVVVWLIKLY